MGQKSQCISVLHAATFLYLLLFLGPSALFPCFFCSLGSLTCHTMLPWPVFDVCSFSFLASNVTITLLLFNTFRVLHETTRCITPPSSRLNPPALTITVTCNSKCDSWAFTVCGTAGNSFHGVESRWHCISHKCKSVYMQILLLLCKKIIQSGKYCQCLTYYNLSAETQVWSLVSGVGTSFDKSSILLTHECTQILECYMSTFSVNWYLLVSAL